MANRVVYCECGLVVEPCKLCVEYAPSAITFHEVNRNEWSTLHKTKSTNGTLPFLELVDSEVVISNPLAMFKSIAEESGLMPQNLCRQTNTLAMIDVIYEFLTKAEMHRGDLNQLFDTELSNILQKVEDLLPSEKSDDALTDESSESDEFPLNGGDILITYLVSKCQHIRVDVALKTFPKLMEIHRQCQASKVISHFFERIKEANVVPELVGLSTPSEANPIRWAFAIGNIGFCYRYVSKESSDALKNTSSELRVPTLKIGEQSFAGRTAILNYAAQRSNLIPKSATLTALAWSHVGNLNQVLDMLDEKVNKSSMKKELPELIARIDRIIGAEQDAEGHVVGGKLSFADLWTTMVYERLCDSASDGAGKLLKSLQTLTPNLRKCYDMVKTIEVVKMFDYRLPQRMPILTYFDIPARAEPIRLVMHIGNIQFEDRRLSRDDWLDRYKSFSPSGQCPVLEVDNKVFVETRAIMTYAAERAGLIPPTALGRVSADMIHSAFGRVLNEQSKIHSVPKGNERDLMRASIREQFLPPILSMIESLCAKEQHPTGYLVDNQLSWVDVYLAAEWQFMLMYRYLSEQSRELYPCLTKVYDLVYSLSAVKEYVNERAAPSTGSYSP